MNMKKGIPILLALALLLLLALPALARLGGSYDLSWWTIDGGGGQVSAGSYALDGAIGQADAGPILTGGGYTLAGGFWSGSDGGGPSQQKVYAPIILK